jgi:hypothetical protein
MGKREAATTATRKRHVDEAGKIAAARTQQLATIKQQVQPGRRKTEVELKANLENAEKAGVTWAPYIVLDELKYWPHWLARVDWTKPKALDELALHIAAEDDDAEIIHDRPDRVDFTWRGTRFNIVQRESSFGDFLFAQLTVDVEWCEAMDVTLACLASAEVKSWRVSNVETLRPGDWMVKLADLGGLIQIEQQKRRQKTG